MLSHSKMEMGKISMDFITRSPITTRQFDSLMVVVDKFSKIDHFIPFKSMHKTSDIAGIFMKEIFKLHGLPKAIILDHDAKFSSKFWKILFQDLAPSLILLQLMILR